MSLPWPEGTYDLFADDDDVIGLTVAKTYPSGWAIVRPEPRVRPDPPHSTAFDEFDVGRFLADCMTHHGIVAELLAGLTPRPLSP